MAVLGRRRERRCDWFSMTPGAVRRAPRAPGARGAVHRRGAGDRRARPRAEQGDPPGGPPRMTLRRRSTRWPSRTGRRAPTRSTSRVPTRWRSGCCEAHPEADADVVLPAILLHDCGYFLVPEEDHLKGLAGAPVGWEPDITRRHEIEGARIAGEILAQVGYDPRAHRARSRRSSTATTRARRRCRSRTRSSRTPTSSGATPRAASASAAGGWTARRRTSWTSWSRAIDTWLLTDAGRELARETLAESRCASW